MSVWQRYRKAFAALIGAATPAGLVGVLALVGVDITPELAAWLIGIGAAIIAPVAVAGAPANLGPHETATDR
ncbi:hypothetical protein CFN78_02595 [Amycolatopsis antarctica]|uniref:Holin n=1 Tax=Amycolatopsis antarctica TaxID=1854586 RepID=A0A263D992_9PSEU|nr:hypothetical protein CFN78_02595 [Amycolatopsis antarctica]